MDVHGVLCVIIVSVFGAAWGGVIVEVPSNDLERTCPYEAVPNTPFDNVLSIMLNGSYECYKPTSAFIGQVDRATTTEEFRVLFQRACDQEQQVRRCMAGMAEDADVCLTPLERTFYASVLEFLGSGITAVCQGGSDTVARMFSEEFMSLDFASRLRVYGCMFASITEYTKGVDLPELTMRRYVAIQNGRQCILNVARGKGKSAAHFESFINPLLSGMKCVSPSTEELVLCSSLQTHDSLDRSQAL